MQFQALAALLLSLFVAFISADTITTITSTSTATRTIIVSEVIASVTSTYATYNMSSIAPTGSVGTNVAVPTSKTASSAPLVTNFSGAAAPNVQVGGVGVMGLFVMGVAALL